MEDFWRNFINGMSIEDHFDYDEEPVVAEPEPEMTDEKAELLTKEANILRLRFDMYILNPTENSKKVYTVNGNQKIDDYGTMTIKDALEMIKSRNRRKS